ncbi:Hypothetical predicted protein, partial [Paramuricea clavata]
MTSIFNLKNVSKCVGLLLMLSEISVQLDSCKMTGKTNYTIYVPLESSFSVNATYACTPPEEVKHVIWELKRTNFSRLAIVTLTPIPYTVFRSGIEAT